NYCTTLQIFWSCIAVLVACTWVSTHPNIPRLKEKMWRGMAERIILMIITLIAPEMMAFWACQDWYSAKRLSKRLKTQGWTKTHAHFALMGGFALYDDAQPVAASSNSLLSFHHTSLSHELPALCENEVKDHSCSDGFSKLLAMSQTTWLIIQLTARVCQRLPATELKIMTTAFAFINLLVYFFWWNKPQGAGCHIRIQCT
ncbi:hypothetical protein BDP27DRAFT_1233880, partial [Rhodocollybia butyracea]